MKRPVIGNFRLRCPLELRDAAEVKLRSLEEKK
jgi:hypothetical protein